MGRGPGCPALLLVSAVEAAALREKNRLKRLDEGCWLAGALVC